MATFPQTAVSVPELPIIDHTSVIDGDVIIIQQSNGTKAISIGELKQAIHTEFIGTIQTFTAFDKGEGNTWSARIPTNYRYCNGDELLIEDYPELFAVIGNNFDGDTPAQSGYFKIPDLRGQFLRGSNGETQLPATKKIDTMRKITGNLSIQATKSDPIDGSFYYIGRGSSSGSGYDGGEADAAFKFGFDSSRLGSNYNGFETAPVHTVLIFGIKVK